MVISQDSPDQLAEYAKPMREIEALHSEKGQANLPDLAGLTLMGVNDVGCARGSTGLRYPIGLETFDPAAARKAYDEFDLGMQKTSELNGSLILLEGYPSQAVRDLPEDSTAFPHRTDNLLVAPFIMYKPDPAIDPIATALGSKIRQHLLDGTDDPSRMRSYLNYAHGDESVQSLYGWEDWRIERLKELKQKWDPENIMRYYVPIA